METNTRITIKHCINHHPLLAKQLKKNSTTFESAIKEFALLTKINEAFLIQNIDRVRNWID